MRARLISHSLSLLALSLKAAVVHPCRQLGALQRLVQTRAPLLSPPLQHRDLVPRAHFVAGKALRTDRAQGEHDMRMRLFGPVACCTPTMNGKVCHHTA